ncbi:MAG: hypothetical protein ACI8ZM_002394 [Crocinitomix sp.]|jgi:hypothetical protein
MNLSKMLYHKYILIFSCISMSCNFAFSQTGPGGAGDISDNQIWLDAHSLNFADGDEVTIWSDLSGNGSNFTQGESSKKPVFSTSGINGVPSLIFDGVNDIMASGAIPALESANITYFMVYDRATTSSDMLITSTYTSSVKKWRTYMNNGQNTILSAHYSPSIKWVRYTDPPGASFFSTHITPTHHQTFNQGDLEMDKSVAYTVPSGHNNVFIGNRNPLTVSGYTFTGEISELIVFNSALNDLERIMVENYLGAKYNMAIPTDHYSFQATHRYGLVGLANDGTNMQTTAQGAGILELSAATDLESDEYYLIAHTDYLPNQFNEIDIPAALDGHVRLERTWRLNETGELGTVTLNFKLGLEDFAASDSYRLLVDDDGTFGDATIVTGTYDGGTSSVSFDVDLADGDFFTLAGLQEILEIHSITDGNWSEATTWDCTCVPNINDEVFIDPFTDVLIDIETSVDQLIIYENGRLEMTDDVNINIRNDWKINGAVNFTGGTVSLIGSDAQHIVMATGTLDNVILNDIVINNSSAEEVRFTGDAFLLNGTLFPNQGNIIISASSTFIVTSTGPSTSGRIGEIISPTTITGQISVERFIPAGLADWRDLSSPVVGSTFDDWDPDLAMGGPGFPDGCAYALEDPCFKSVRYTNYGVEVNVLNSYEPIVNSRGYNLFVGSDLETFDGTTLTSTGTLNTSTDIVKSYSTGWTTVGNPYASPISYQNLGKSSSISKYFYVYDAASGVYQWYDQTSGTASIPEITSAGLMATGQGIWIFATSAGTITYRQLAKSDANATYIRDSERIDKSLQITLQENNSTYHCAAILQEKDGAIDGLDDSLDIRHFSNEMAKGPSISFQDIELLRKNYIGNDGRDKTFSLATTILNEGYYTISADNWSNFRNYRSILLYDKNTGETINLKEGNYIFYGEKANEDKQKNRFNLILSNAEATNNDDGIYSNNISEISNLSIKQMGSIVDITAINDEESITTITLTNVLGQNVVFSTALLLNSGSNIITIPNNLKGFHIITIQTKNEQLTMKLVL